jgi:hypothetical protein
LLKNKGPLARNREYRLSTVVVVDALIIIDPCVVLGFGLVAHPFATTIASDETLTHLRRKEDSVAVCWSMQTEQSAEGYSFVA